MDSFTVNWEMIDPTDSKVTMTLQGDANNALEILGSRKTIIEKALERGWTFNTNPLGKAPVSSNGRSENNQGSTCRHGEMKWKTGTSRKNNKPYKGWFCPANECEPRFVRERASGRRDYESEPAEYGEYR